MESESGNDEIISGGHGLRKPARCEGGGVREDEDKIKSRGWMII